MEDPERKFYTFEGTSMYTKQHNEERFVIPYEAGVGITNFMIHGAYERVEFIVGGVRIDCQKKGLWNETVFMPHATIIPLLEHHEIQFVVHGRDGVCGWITLDYVKLTNYDPKEIYYVPITQTQYEKFPVTLGKNRAQLYFNHPVTKIKVVSKVKLKETVLNIPEVDWSTSVNPEVTFDESINFSRINSSYLDIEAEGNGEVTVVAENKQIAMFMTGMMGLRYAD
jgi:hypothetical protein